MAWSRQVPGPSDPVPLALLPNFAGVDLDTRYGYLLIAGMLPPAIDML